MKSMKSCLSQCALSVLAVACGQQNSSLDAEAQRATASNSSQARVVFRCTLKETGKSFEVLEKGGLLSIGGSPYRNLPVSKSVDPEGDVRTYSFLGANIIDGINYGISLNIGTDRNPDSVSTDGDVFNCKWKATVNSAVLDTLAAREENMVKAILAKANELKLCEGERDTQLGYGTTLGSFPVSSREWLVAISCFMGAYQGHYQLVRWNDAAQKGELQKVEEYDFETKKVKITVDLFGLPGFNFATNSFSNFAKGRGLGDCGTLSEFKPFSGPTLQLKVVRSKEACDGVYVDPTEWPIVYKAPGA